MKTGIESIVKMNKTAGETSANQHQHPGKTAA